MAYRRIGGGEASGGLRLNMSDYRAREEAKLIRKEIGSLESILGKVSIDVKRVSIDGVPLTEFSTNEYYTDAGIVQMRERLAKLHDKLGTFHIEPLGEEQDSLATVINPEIIVTEGIKMLAKKFNNYYLDQTSLPTRPDKQTTTTPQPNPLEFQLAA